MANLTFAITIVFSRLLQPLSPVLSILLLITHAYGSVR